ncbi:2,3-bisphosphoglycerate-independent phosphoglycerate mutase [Candidatus Peregrinibacteria bacterium HGW-Peregrinibacteria-1]|jgi:2,3-bisphosphoglycerate-independent phosphoglycerate mutase|nr:MAG: 2,3-bisphosphoglycerate-independent phosphoglycerate mutase [Candidatus Peregrinibacteria bacterium HGW-Peregrinibacteria-1]
MAAQKVMLVVIDGYGEGVDSPYNAVTRADTPFIDRLRREGLMTKLSCCSESVGLPPNTMGGSEVGHFTLGAGRIVWQSLQEINRSIDSGEFFEKAPLLEAIVNCQKNGSALHLVGMISDQGIHSHIDHLFALMKLAKDKGVEKLYIHAIADGRDVPERSVKRYLELIEEKIRELGVGEIVSLVGRYFAMDRDENIDRTKFAYDLMTQGIGDNAEDVSVAVDKQYNNGVDTDYYLKPIILNRDAVVRNEDSVVFFNYRSDRAKQLTATFTENVYDFGVVRPFFVCFGPYSKVAPVLFQANPVVNNLGEVLSHAGKRQLRVAETEKYPHVTFFFNSQRKDPFEGEDHILVPSPKVPSYDLKPEMSSYEIRDAVVEKLEEAGNLYDFVLINFANADLVGHSGDFEATVRAVESIDECLADIVLLAREKGYVVMVTGDHGNAEMMKYENGEACPSHTFNDVFFVLLSEEEYRLRGGSTGLQDVAPTILEVMGVPKPIEMTGESLIE